VSRYKITRRDLFKINQFLIIGLYINQFSTYKWFWTKPKTKGRFFSLVEISAQDNFELGEKIGRNFRHQIQLGIKRRKKWLAKLKNFAQEKPKERILPFLSSLKEHFPQYLDELKGIAHGAELDFNLLFILNLNPELGAMMRKAKETNCSTIMVKAQDKILLGHNEDGSEKYLDLMFLLKARTPKGEFLVLTYPGIIPGNGPGINNYGIIHTCNFIGSKNWQEGVPRYFIDRAMLEAKNMKQAIKTASHPARAYSQAHNLVSVSENRAVLVESSVNKVAVKEIKGVQIHTNHYLLKEMKQEEEFSLYKAGSLPRLKAIEKELKGLAPNQLDLEKIHQALSIHHNYPFSPCRHPNRIIPGATLGSFLFSSSPKLVRYYYQAPCQNLFKDFSQMIKSF